MSATSRMFGQRRALPVTGDDVKTALVQQIKQARQMIRKNQAECHFSSALIWEKQLVTLLTVWRIARMNARQPARRRTLESDLREDR